MVEVSSKAVTAVNAAMVVLGSDSSAGEVGVCDFAERGGLDTRIEYFCHFHHNLSIIKEDDIGQRLVVLHQLIERVSGHPASVEHQFFKRASAGSAAFHDVSDVELARAFENGDVERLQLVAGRAPSYAPTFTDSDCNLSAMIDMAVRPVS